MKNIRLYLLLIGLLCISCSRERVSEVSYVRHPDWAPDVKSGINAFFDDCAGMDNAYVVFDFDNTSSIFDVGKQFAVYQLETMSFAMSPDRLPEVLTSGLEGCGDEYPDWITDISAAYASLYSKYGPFTAKGLSSSSQQFVRTDPQWQEFSTKMLAMYDKVADWKSVEDSYCWLLFWLTGMNEAEVYELAYASHRKYAGMISSIETWTSPSSISSRLGQKSVIWTSGVQVTENIRELWKCLKENGIDVWVCSASGMDQIRAAVDAFGLRECCTGVLAMTVSKDDEGLYTNSYDYVSGYSAIPSAEGWTRGNLPIRARTSGEDKVTSIMNAIAPLYSGATPLAGFMDSTGDFNFCTEFSSLRMVVCFNRADRKITDGGGLIAEIAVYERETLGYDYPAAQKAGDTFYILQGRDENGLRSFRPSNLTVRLGETEERLFANQDNYDQLAAIIDEHLSVKEAINRFAENFLASYRGYHSR